MGMWHRVPRELKANGLRYAALFFLVMLGVFVVVGLVGAAESVTHTVAVSAVQNNREDGQFTTFLPLTHAQMQELEQTGIQLEAQFYLDFYLPDGAVLRLYPNRNAMNLFQADEGTGFAKENEILLEKLYAASHGLTPGSTVTIGGFSLKVVGLGTTPDYDMPLQNLTDVAADKHAFGVAFVDQNTYDALLKSGLSHAGETYGYAYRLNGVISHSSLKERIKTFTLKREEITEKYLLEIIERKERPKDELLQGIAELVDGGATLQEALDTLDAQGDPLMDSLAQASMPPSALEPVKGYTSGVSSAAKGAGELHQGLQQLQSETQILADELFPVKIENLVSFLPAENNPRIAASVDDISINKTAGLLAGIIAIALFGYVIATFVLQTIEQESPVIGTLFALGIPRKNLLCHYLILPLAITLLGGVAGMVLGFSPIGISTQIQDTAAYYSFPQPQQVFPLYLLLYGLLMPPLIALLVNWLVVRSRLNRPPLILLRKQATAVPCKGPNLEKLSFLSMFRIRQILREKQASIVVFGGMLLALLLLILSVNCYSMIHTLESQNSRDILFETMTVLKYPPEKVPENTHAATIVNLKKEIHGYEMDVSLLGLAPENPYFAFEPKAGVGSITLSSSVAKKFNVKVGDIFSLTDDVTGRHYAFMVDKIVPYSPGLYAFMELDSMREVFGLEQDSFNVLFSSAEPNVEPGRILSLIRKNDILRYGRVFMDGMTPMIVMLLTVSVTMFVIVLYLMLKMMVDRSATGISLMKVFGYNNREVRKLYLDGHFITVLISALVGIPLAKIIMDAVYPYLIANVSFGPDMALPATYYVTIFGFVLAAYLVISQCLNHRLKKISANEVLKQRE